MTRYRWPAAFQTAWVVDFENELDA